MAPLSAGIARSMLAVALGLLLWRAAGTEQWSAARTWAAAWLVAAPWLLWIADPTLPSAGLHTLAAFGFGAAHLGLVVAAAHHGPARAATPRIASAAAAVLVAAAALIHTAPSAGWLLPLLFAGGYLFAAGAALRSAEAGAAGVRWLAAVGWTGLAVEQVLGAARQPFGPVAAWAAAPQALAGIAPLLLLLDAERDRAREAVAQLRRMELHDSSTNLPNRRLFLEQIGRAVADARQTGGRFAVIHLDVDRFKVINDAWSPAVGDAVLRGVGERLRQLLRPGDVLARLHGDSFGLLLADAADDQQVLGTAQRLARRLGPPFALSGREIVLTASFGVTCFPEHGADANELLRNADAAMYRAKEAGRNRTMFYVPTMNTRAADRLALEQALRYAIGNDELVLHYQPIVELRSGRIVRFEALLRWNHPERGLLPPDDFLALAEPTGLADAIDQWVLRTACTEALTWRAHAAFQPPQVAVNLSTRSFQQSDLVPRIETVLADTGLPAGALELEITESAAMGDAEATLAVLRQLKQAGVHLAIDDFGTGYSSLSYLRTFPIDTLKIDRAFVRDLGRERNALALIAGIIALGRSLELAVVAEGIETRDQWSILHAEGCHLLQGFLIGRPVPAGECHELLTRPRRFG